MTSKQTKRERDDEHRRAIWKQAEEMCVPAFMTPLWQQAYGRAALSHAEVK